MNGKAAKTLRALGKSSSRDKKRWREMSQIERYKLRWYVERLKRGRKIEEHLGGG